MSLPIIAGHGARTVVCYECACNILDDQIVFLDVPIINYSIFAPGDY